jgi:glycosyltransferase involved in cell wall biosynthesis
MLHEVCDSMTPHSVFAGRYLLKRFQNRIATGRWLGVDSCQLSLRTWGLHLDLSPGEESMSTHLQPLVSVLTPVYNGEKYLAECIESVLKQTYRNYEYIIVNNCSTDQTLQIALAYAQKDSRIRVHNNEKFVGVIANHNIAFGLIDAEAKYCKIVSGDDFIFPECITRMVELAEANPSVGIVGAYQISGESVKWQGLRYPRAVTTGVEMCRRIFLGGDKTFGFGSPTSLLYRADLVRKSPEFYPNPSPHSDSSTCFQCLTESDYGFVYEVLAYERIHEETQSHASAQINRFTSAYLSDVITYGPLFLSKKELSEKLDDTLYRYHRYLALNYLVESRGKEFWDYHKNRLAELGYPLTRFALFKATVITVLREIVNPRAAIAKIRRYLFQADQRTQAVPDYRGTAATSKLAENK